MTNINVGDINIHFTNRYLRGSNINVPWINRMDHLPLLYGCYAEWNCDHICPTPKDVNMRIDENAKRINKKFYTYVYTRHQTNWKIELVRDWSCNWREREMKQQRSLHEFIDSISAGEPLASSLHPLEHRFNCRRMVRQCCWIFEFSLHAI